MAISAHGGSLLTRVARLLGAADEPSRSIGWLAVLIVMLTLTIAGALGAGLLTPPEKPTEGLPNDAQPTTKTTAPNKETSGPSQRRGQETRAEHGNAAPASKHGRFIGRVRLKTEKTLPDLSNLKLPPGKILDESLVFSKEGGLANVFVYWRKPPDVKVTVKLDPEPGPFLLTSRSGRFSPHAAVLLVGRPLEFANADKWPSNFRTAAIKNALENRLVQPESSVAVPAFNAAENLPVQVVSNISPWMSAWVFPLDHPFAAVTDADGRFSIDGLPPGEHEFRVWHERVGYLNKKLNVTIKTGEETRTDLAYEPSRFELSDDALRAWSLQVIDVKQPVVPRPKVPPVGTPPAVSQRDPTVENANRRIREELARLTEVAFTDTPLSDVLIFLGDYHTISVTFDISAKERVKNLETVPITLTMSGEDLATALSRMLHSSQLSYFIDAGQLWIATPDEVRRRGHLVPESFAAILEKLRQADVTVPWEKLLLGLPRWGAEAYAARDQHIEILTKLLAQPDAVVQRHAAVVLARFEEHAAPARLALEKLTSSEDRAVCRAAWNALLAIGHDDLSTWPLFLAAWIEGDDVVRHDWPVILHRFNPQVFAKLTKLFPSVSLGFRQAIVGSVRARAHDEVTEPLVLLAFDDEDRTVRLIALRSSRHQLSEAMRAGLRRRLRDEDPSCRVIAANRLLLSSEDRAAALDVLLSELARDDSSQKEAVLAIFSNQQRSLPGSPVRDFLLRRSVFPNNAERLPARQALKVVPEEKQMSGALKHVDQLFEIRKNEPTLSPAQRVQVLDEEMQDLLTRNNPSEEQRARVNHRVAHQFANWDIRQHSAIVRKYAEAGLKLDVDPARRASLHSLLGSAALVNTETKTFAEQRRHAAAFWLAGYREVASLKLPKTAPELPVVEKLGDVLNESPEERAAREQQHAEQIEARQQAEFIRQMVEHRHELARLLVETYQRAPADEIELRLRTKEVLIDQSLVESLLAEGAIPLGATEPPPKNSGEQGGVSPPVSSKTNAESPAKNRGVDATPLAKTREDVLKPAIKRGMAFLKAQQQNDGTWQGQPVDGVTALCAAALLQAGVKADDPVMQKALAHLRKVEPALSYTVALQTMVFCWASPKEDAELIQRNVAWLEKAQVTDGKSRGSWSYALANGGRGDGSCSRFAMLGLDAAKTAGFAVNEETWRRASDYWLTTQRENGGWGYTADSGATLSMTLSGVAGLATANRHLPKEEQTKTREAAIRKPAEFIAKSMAGLPNAMFVFYVLHSLERAGHLSGHTRFGELDWKADTMKRLAETQQPNGSWKGATPTEGDLIATSFALLVLTGQSPVAAGPR